MGGAGGCARRRKSARIRAAPRASGSPRPRGTSRGRGTAAPACGTCCPHPRRPQAPRGPTAPRRSGAAATRPSRGRALAAARDPWPPTPPRRRTRHTQHPPQLAAAGMAARHPRTIGPKPHLDAVADRIERVALGDAKLLRAPAALELEDQRPASEPQARERRAGSARQRREAPVLAPHRHDLEHRRHRPERRGRSVLGERVLEGVEPEAPEPALRTPTGGEARRGRPRTPARRRGAPRTRPGTRGSVSGTARPGHRRRLPCRHRFPARSRPAPATAETSGRARRRSRRAAVGRRAAAFRSGPEPC